MTPAIEQMNRIKDRLRVANSAEEIAKIADEERQNVLDLAAKPETKVLAVHISHLKSYMLQVVLPAKGKRRRG